MRMNRWPRRKGRPCPRRRLKSPNFYGGLSSHGAVAAAAATSPAIFRKEFTETSHGRCCFVPKPIAHLLARKTRNSSALNTRKITTHTQSSRSEHERVSVGDPTALALNSILPKYRETRGNVKKPAGQGKDTFARKRVPRATFIHRFLD